MISRLFVAEPLCEPDWGCVSDHRENHQPGRAEDFGSAGEGLWSHLFHHQRQIGKGQVSVCCSEAHLRRTRNKRRHLGANEKQRVGTEQISGRCISPDIKSRFHLFSCRADVAYNKSVRLHSFLCGALGIILPTLFILSLIANTVSGEQLEELLGEGAARCVTLLTVSPQTDGGVLCRIAERC